MGGNNRRLRAWQSEAITAYHAASKPDFLVTAIPGAGKTTFALALAAEMLEARAIDRVIIVVPTDHLRTQWATAAYHAGLTLDPTLGNTDRLTEDFVGYVTTYAQVGSRSAVHRRRCESRRTLVILDEIHHAADGMSWGDAVYEAFSPARRRLALTGTPFRTSPKERIPFVTYETDGEWIASVADFGYGYRQALTDHVVRPVMFAAYSGHAKWRNSAGAVLEASLADALNSKDEQRAWRTVLNPKGRWIPHVIAAADERLTHLRASGIPDAGAMLLASTQEDAKAYADIVKHVTGHTPVVVISEDPAASAKIEAFTTSSDRWLIAVRLVSEGVDVPRLAVCVWACNYRTPLFFAQAVGRVVRSRRPGETATVFLPAVRPLLTLAAEMEEERNAVLAPPPDDKDLDGLDEVPVGEETPTGIEAGWEALDAEAEFAAVLASGRAVTVDPYSTLDDDDADYAGIPGLLSADEMAALLAKRDARHRAMAATTTAADPAAARQVWVDAARVRRDINTMVSRLAAKTGQPHASVHGMIRRAVPGPPSAQASLEVLTARRDWLLQRSGT